MKKNKYTFVPFNLLWSVPSFFIPCILLPDIFTLDTYQTLIISLAWYFNDVRQGTETDYLQHLIDLKQDK